MINNKILLQAVSVSLMILLTACGGGGGNSSTPNNTNTVSTQTGTISGAVSGTTIIAFDENGDIVASDDTAGRTPDLDLDGNGILESFSFTLSNIPLNQGVRIYLITGGGIYPMFFDTDSDGSSDNNVFSLAAESTVDLGFVNTEVLGESGRAIPDNNPVSNTNIIILSPILSIPPKVNQPPTSGLTLSALIDKGLNALDSGWVLGAKSYFEDAVAKAGAEASNDADTARFMLALTRFTALGFDTLSDGNSADMNRLGDLLDRTGVANDSRRANWDLMEGPLILPADTPTGGDIQNFLYDVIAPELTTAVANLDNVSTSFNRILTNPLLGTGSVEVDYGDVLFFKAVFKSILASISIQRAYDLDVDIDAIDNEVATIQSVLASDPSILSLADTSKLTEARTLSLSMLDDIEDALAVILAESDNQDDDLITTVFSWGLEARNGSADLALWKIINQWEITEMRDVILNGSAATSAAANNDVSIDWKLFFAGGLDFRSPSSLLPPFIGNDVAGLLPDPTMNNIVINRHRDFNKDRNINGIPDILE